MLQVAFTGGGTAGHVTPNVALIEAASQRGHECFYIGSKKGIEAAIVADCGVPYFGIASGKLRRYFSWQNFLDPMKILWGFFQALWILQRRRPNVLFSKGGFVAVPVVFAAALLRIKVIIHESDLTPGLANRLSAPLSDRVCLNFAETQLAFKGRVTEVTGTPLRASLREANAERGRSYLNMQKPLDPSRPILLVFGGSLGSHVLNRCVRVDLDALIERFQVVHVVGQGAVEVSLLAYPSYYQFEFLGAEFGDVLAAADLVISRAGANALYELLCFQKPQLLVPLTKAASRGDQLENAALFEEKGYAMVLSEERLAPGKLALAASELWVSKQQFLEQLQAYRRPDSVLAIWQLIEEVADLKRPGGKGNR